MLATLLPYIQIILSVLIIAFVLLQRSGAGVSSAFGGDNFSSAFHTRRGFEKFLFYGTMVLAVLFALSALLAFVR